MNIQPESTKEDKDFKWKENGVWKHVDTPTSHRFRNLIGQTFGRYQVVGYLGFHGGESIYHCKCSCGNEKSAGGRKLVTGNTKSCGCIHKEGIRDRHVKNRKIKEGDIFGRLTVNRMVVDTTAHKTDCICLCECGKEATVRAGSLLSGLTKSCGCLKKETTEANNKKKRHIKGGDVFNRLTVSSVFVDDKRQRAMCECVCSCGKSHTIKSYNLLSGSTKSCGCLKSEISSKLCREKKTNFISQSIRENVKIQRVLLHRYVKDGHDSNGDALSIIGLSHKEIREYIRVKKQKYMSWPNWGRHAKNADVRKWNIDHIIPISKSKNISDIFYYSYYLNLSPMWSDENLSKHTKCSLDETEIGRYKESVDLDRFNRGLPSIRELVERQEEKQKSSDRQ